MVSREVRGGTFRGLLQPLPVGLWFPAVVTPCSSTRISVSLQSPGKAGPTGGLLGVASPQLRTATCLRPAPFLSLLFSVCVWSFRMETAGGWLCASGQPPLLRRGAARTAGPSREQSGGNLQPVTPSCSSQPWGNGTSFPRSNLSSRSSPLAHPSLCPSADRELHWAAPTPPGLGCLHQSRWHV